MGKLKNNTGYTLLELMITILIGSIITLATTTILLLGLRLNNESNKTVEKQNTARILLTALEDLATEGEIYSIEYTANSWEIIGTNPTNLDIPGNPIFSYDAEKSIIYSGTSSGTPLLEEVVASHVMMNDEGLLTFSIETDEGTYSSSVFCRTEKKVTYDDDQVFEEIIQKTDAIGTTKARKAFLKVLASQYGSTGFIKAYKDSELGITIEPTTLLHYYVQDYNANWELDTPWCAIFISWALEEVQKADYIENIPYESHVREYENYFKYELKSWKERGETPASGDIIFFDWDPDKRNGYDHVGAVLKIDETTTPHTIYTIEGNTANMVAVRSYDIDDPDIVGYGVLDWKQNP